MPSATKDPVEPSTPWLKSPTPNPRSRFRQLINDIRSRLGSDNSIVSSDSLRRSLQHLLEAYESEEIGWEEYAFRDASQTFTRNLVDRGNGSYNLVSRLADSKAGRESRLTHPVGIGLDSRFRECDSRPCGLSLHYEGAWQPFLLREVFCGQGSTRTSLLTTRVDNQR